MEQPVNPSGEKKGPDEYEVKRWADTIQEAEEIKQDPEKWELVKKVLHKKKKAINSLQELRDIAHGNKKLPSQMEEEESED